MTSPAALYLQDAHPIAEGMEYTKYAEQKGFEAVWQADSRLVRDAIVPMSAFAAVTDKIKIGSGVVDCWTRNPARLAATTLPAGGAPILRRRDIQLIAQGRKQVWVIRSDRNVRAVDPKRDACGLVGYISH